MLYFIFWWWWWIWIVFIVLVIALPTGYGWGYRGWGPPYPRYRYRGRRGNIVEYEEIDDPRRTAPPPHTSGWGIVADLIWLAILGAIIWAIVAFWI